MPAPKKGAPAKVMPAAKKAASAKLDPKPKQPSLKQLVESALAKSKTKSQAYYCVNTGKTVTSLGQYGWRYAFYSHEGLHICGVPSSKELTSALAELEFPPEPVPPEDEELEDDGYESDKDENTKAALKKLVVTRVIKDASDLGFSIEEIIAELNAYVAATKDEGDKGEEKPRAVPKKNCENEEKDEEVCEDDDDWEEKVVVYMPGIVSRADVKDRFGRYGRIISIAIKPLWNGTDRAGSICSLRFADRRNMQNALAENGKEWRGGYITVNVLP